MFNPLRPKALTIPEVTVCPKPNGLPIAIAKSPTRSLSESATLISVKLSASICNSAMSLSASEPIFLLQFDDHLLVLLKFHLLFQ